MSSPYNNAFALWEKGSQAVYAQDWRRATLSFQMLASTIRNLDHHEGLYRMGRMYLIGASEEAQDAIENYHHALAECRDPKWKAARLRRRRAQGK